VDHNWCHIGQRKRWFGASRSTHAMTPDDLHMHMLDRFLSNLDVRLVAFTICDVREGWRIDFPPVDVAGMHLILRGNGWIGAAGSRFAVSCGTFVLIPAGFAYMFESAPGAPNVLPNPLIPSSGPFPPVIQAGDGPQAFAAACGLMTATHGGALDLFRTLPRPLARRLDSADLLAEQFSRLSAELGQPRVGTRPMIETLLKQCLVLMLRDPVPADALGMPWSPGVAHPPLWRAFVTMVETMETAHSLDSLAATAGMGRSAFTAHFAKAFGRPPMALLREMRLRRAAALLADGQLPIETVARRVGYTSRSQFSRAFKEFHGKDPRSFRNG
jgi:AraC-like DNA-binding protein